MVKRVLFIDSSKENKEPDLRSLNIKTSQTGPDSFTFYLYNIAKLTHNYMINIVDYNVLKQISV